MNLWEWSAGFGIGRAVLLRLFSGCVFSLVGNAPYLPIIDRGYTIPPNVSLYSLPCAFKLQSMQR